MSRKLTVNSFATHRHTLPAADASYNSLTVKHSINIDRKCCVAEADTHTLWLGFPSMATMKPTPHASCSFWGSYNPCAPGAIHSHCSWALLSALASLVSLASSTWPLFTSHSLLATMVFVDCWGRPIDQAILLYFYFYRSHSIHRSNRSNRFWKWKYRRNSNS